MKKHTSRILFTIGLFSLLLTGCNAGDLPTQPGALQSIRVAEKPTKTSYTVGEVFDKSGLVVNAVYENLEKSINNYSLSISSGHYAFTENDVGTKEIEITYQRTFKTSFTVSVIADQGGGGGEDPDPVTITGIKITSNPSKMSYKVGELFSSDGLIVKVTKSDNTEEFVYQYGLSLDEGYQFVAGDVGNKIVTVSYSNFTATFTLTVSQDSQPTTYSWDLVTDSSTLRAGDVVIIGATYSSNTYSTGTYGTTSTSQYLAGAAVTKSGDSITTIQDSVNQFTLSGSSSAGWTFNTSSSVLYRSATKKINFTNGTTDKWSISISGGSATISPNGGSAGERILFNYNQGNSRFTTYTSTATATMLLPSIYRGKSADPIYPTDITVTAPTTSLVVGGESQIAVTYEPADTNERHLSFSSSDTSVATVTAGGLIRGVKAGNATITIKAEALNGAYITKTIDVTVSNVPVTSVTLDASRELTLNTTATLTPTILPSNATNKEVTWSSSNSSVVSASATGVLTGKALGTATITVTTVDGGKTASCNVTVVEKSIAKWTLMMYVCGSNLESQDGAATNDIAEIVSAGTKPSDVNIILCTGGAKSWKKYGISASKITYYELQNNTSSPLKKISESSFSKTNSMGNQNTLQSFVTWGLENYPAQKTGLVMWNHGGAMWGCCFDEKYETSYSDYDMITSAELTTAVGNSMKAVGRTEKLEFVGYDCCLMQVQDIAEANSQYFNYMVASEESELGDGWAYDEWIPTLYSTTNTDEVLTMIADTQPGQYSSYGSENDQTQSYLDLSKMSDYHTKFEALSVQIKNNISTSKLKTLLGKVKSFEKSDYGLYDIGDFMNKLYADSTYKAALGTYLTNAQSAYSSLVAHSAKGAGAGNATGLALVYGSGMYYGASTNFTSWYAISGD